MSDIIVMTVVLVAVAIIAINWFSRTPNKPRNEVDKIPVHQPTDGLGGGDIGDGDVTVDGGGDDIGDNAGKLDVQKRT